MVPSGPPTPISGSQSVSSSLLRTNSSIPGGGAQTGSIQSQPHFSSLVSPRTQFNSNSFLGNLSNVSSLLNQSFVNGGAGSAVGFYNPSVNLQQRGGLGSSIDMVDSAEPDPMSFAASSSSPAQGQPLQSPGNQLGSDHPQPQQLEAIQNFQQQFLVPQSQQQQQLRGGSVKLEPQMGPNGPVKLESQMGPNGPVKLEPQMGPNDQNGMLQPVQTLRGIAPVKMEPHQLQSLRSFGPVKIEQQHLEQNMFLQQQQQQQQQQHFLQLSRQASQPAAAQLSLLQRQRILQMQQQQQQQQQQQHQILTNLPQQRTQFQQQLHQNSLPVRAPVKSNLYEPGTCARRLTQYMYRQQHRPEDNNIEFWRKFVAEYFAPNAKKRWCVSLYGSGRQTTGVFPQDVWHCEICNRKPGRGFETTVEVLPRLCQIKYASGTLEELLYVDMPHEYHNASGQIVLDYAKAIQESVFEQLRVVRDGQLRIVFNTDLKICSWEFCARRHEELIPRRQLIPQVSQLGAVVQKYQSSAQNSSANLSAQDLQNSCNAFVTSARQLAKALEVPLVNDLGYTKRYVRCLQISEVVNSMKDLIDYSRETGTGPIDSLINFPRRTSASGPHAQQAQQHERQQSIPQNADHNDPNSFQATMQLHSASNGVHNPTSTSATTVAGILHQSSMSSRQENQMSAVNSHYSGGNTVQLPSAGSSSSLPLSHPNPSSPFPSPTPSTSNNQTPNSHNTMLNSMNPPANLPTVQVQPTATRSHDADPTESSVQQILQDIMMSSQLNGGNEIKGVNGITSAINGGNCLVRNGIATNSGMGGTGFGGMGGLGPSANGIRGAIANSAMTMNGRVGVNSISQDPTAMRQQQQQPQQDMGNQMLGELGDFDNIDFDWKSSP